jgi:hypothetical protein
MKRLIRGKPNSQKSGIANIERLYRNVLKHVEDGNSVAAAILTEAICQSYDRNRSRTFLFMLFEPEFQHLTGDYSETVSRTLNRKDYENNLLAVVWRSRLQLEQELRRSGSTTCNVYRTKKILYAAIKQFLATLSNSAVERALRKRQCPPEENDFRGYMGLYSTFLEMAERADQPIILNEQWRPNLPPKAPEALAAVEDLLDTISGVKAISLLHGTQNRIKSANPQGLDKKALHVSDIASNLRELPISLEAKLVRHIVMEMWLLEDLPNAA